MIFSWIVVVTCFVSLLQASACGCTLLFLVAIVGYFAAAVSGIMYITNPYQKMPILVGMLFLVPLSALAVNGIWLDARYLGRISEYRYSTIEAAMLMLFVLLEMLPRKQPLRENTTVTCDR